MAGPSTKKRSHADSAAAGKPGKRVKPNRKQRRVLQYNSDDSDEDLDNARANDTVSRSAPGVDSEQGIDMSVWTPATRTKKPVKEKKTLGKKPEEISEKPTEKVSEKPSKTISKKPLKTTAETIPKDNLSEDESDKSDKSDNHDGASAESDDDVDVDDEVEFEDDDDDDDFTGSEDGISNIGSKRPKSKRNDPDAFATSLQKILSTVRCDGS
jgi:hypothetical protein